MTSIVEIRYGSDEFLGLFDDAEKFLCSKKVNPDTVTHMLDYVWNFRKATFDTGTGRIV